MSTLISDTLKQRNHAAFPIVEVGDLSLADNTRISNVISPATDSKLGLVKIGDNIVINDEVINIPHYLSIGNEEPTDGSLLWIDPNSEFSADSMTGLVSAEDDNLLQLKDDGIYMPDHTGLLDGVYYIDGRPFMLTKTVTYYVYSATGDDTNGDGSATAPFKTINKLLEVLPTHLSNYTLNIYIKGTFTENCDFANLSNGNIRIYMESTPVINGYLRFYNCQRVYIYRSFKVNYTSPTGTWSSAFLSGQNSFVYLNNDLYASDGNLASWTVTITGTTSTTYKMRGLTASQGGRILCTNDACKVYVNSCYQAFYSEAGSELTLIYPYSSSASTYGLCAYYGATRYGTKYNSATTAYATGNGGRVYGGGQSSVGKY